MGLLFSCGKHAGPQKLCKIESPTAHEKLLKRQQVADQCTSHNSASACFVKSVKIGGRIFDFTQLSAFLL